MALALYRLVIEHGMTWQILYLRALSAGESFEEALAELERDRIPRAAVAAMASVEVPAPAQRK